MATLPKDNNNEPIQLLGIGQKYHTIGLTTTSNVNPTALSSDTVGVLLWSDIDTHLLVSNINTIHATTANAVLPANTKLMFATVGNRYISANVASGTGTLHITELKAGI